MTGKHIFNGNSEQLARLLALGSTADGEPQMLPGVSEDGLDLPVSGEAGAPHPDIQARAIGDLLLRPDTDLAELTSLKQYAKDLSRQDGPELSREVAITVYYAAIAAALMHHRRKIANFSYGELEAAFTRLIEADWVAWDIADLLARARKICQDNAE
ncbi:MAG: hypothetical protein QGH60_01980 [Phycisphaerae bacterium]|jgi:hypothetical protein|nr:hypothetical protein [Phycisphaerae bacterium]